MTLLEKHCSPKPAGSPPLDKAEAQALLKEAPGWEIAADNKEISRLFTFDHYWGGVVFTDAVAWIAQTEKHHPDVELTYKKVKVRFSTHSVGGLSENDFICAARINTLMPQA